MSSDGDSEIDAEGAASRYGAAPIVERANYSEWSTVIHAIRHAVFVEGQGVPVELERDAEDAAADHVLVAPVDAPIGPGTTNWVATGRVLRNGHLGRIAVLAPFRGRGLGVAVVRALEACARERGLGTVHLNSQVDAIAFYERLGYRAIGDRFFEAGIEHVRMERALSDGSPSAGDPSR